MTQVGGKKPALASNIGGGHVSEGPEMKTKTRIKAGIVRFTRIKARDEQEDWGEDEMY